MSNSVFLKSYEGLRSALRSALMTEQDPDVLLAIAKLYGGFCWANHDDSYFDDGVEKHLIAKLAHHFEKDLGHCREHEDDTVVIIASALFDAFGHSAVVDKWLKMMGQKCPHKLIVTRSIAGKISERINGYKIPTHRCTSRGMSGIKEIIRAAESARMIVLHTHPDDIEAVIAARLLKSIGVTVVFYNHADHVFSYGISAADIVCEISLYGLKISRRSNRVMGKTFFLGIPLTPTAQIPVDHETATAKTAGMKTVLSCGSGYKYRPAGGQDFSELIDRVLEARTDVQILMVGPNGKEKWWSESISRWGKRVRFAGILPANEYAHQLQSADVYVDSFPLCGGTAFPEALLAGAPATGLNVPIQGYTFADELRVDTVAALLKRICLLLDGDLTALDEANRVRAMVIAHQAEEAFISKLEILYSTKADDREEFIDITGCKLDDRFLHNVWLQQQKIHLISRSIRELPVALKFKVLGLVLKNIQFMNFKNLMETVWVVLKTTAIPAFLRRRKS